MIVARQGARRKKSDFWLDPSNFNPGGHPNQAYLLFVVAGSRPDMDRLAEKVVVV
jgi:hypothetical protein